MRKFISIPIIVALLFFALPTVFASADNQQPQYVIPTATAQPNAGQSSGNSYPAPQTAIPTATAQPTNATTSTTNTNQTTASTCGTSYTVQSGDTLSSIALKCGVDYNALVAANTNISDVNSIFPGQVVNIPQSSTIPNTGGTGSSSSYTVVAGDYLFAIAQRFNTTVQSIVNANTFITDPNLIFPGQVLTIPAGSGIPNTGGGNTYTVQPGDTLSSIAQRYNTTVQSLVNANSFITNPNLILAGWNLTLP